VAGGATVQCAGFTKAGKQCTRQVKVGTGAEDMVKYCHQHMKEVLSNTGFYSRKTGAWVEFKGTPLQVHASIRLSSLTTSILRLDS
jgi:hypothetical protein